MSTLNRWFIKDCDRKQKFSTQNWRQELLFTMANIHQNFQIHVKISELTY